VLFTPQCRYHCFLSRHNFPEVLPETQTEMYKLFTTSIIIQHLQKCNQPVIKSLEDLRGEEAECFKNVCRIAFDMTVKSRQAMSHGDLYVYNKSSLGLVTIDVPVSWDRYCPSYSFLHLNLQEFLAAYHISKLTQEKQKEVIEMFFETVHMLTIREFYCELAKNGESLIKMITKTKSRSQNTSSSSVQRSHVANKKSIAKPAPPDEFETHGNELQNEPGEAVVSISDSSTQLEPNTDIKAELDVARSVFQETSTDKSKSNMEHIERNGKC